MCYRISIYGILIVVLIQSAFVKRAQGDIPSVTASIDHDSIQIGGQARIGFSIASPASYLWQWPEITDQIIKNIEVVSQSAIDTISPRGSDLFTLHKQVLITSFDSNYYAIPPFQFKYRTPDDTTWNLVETQPFLLYVAGVNVDFSASIRDIKKPVGAPLTLLEILPWLLLLIVLVSALVLYRYYLIRKRARILLAPKPPKPKIPPHTRALDALEKLRQKKLWQNGRLKEYHSELTDILRHYIEERFEIMAVEMTSTEILDTAKESNLPEQATEKLTTILQRADIVKFAKGIPLPEEHEDSFACSIDFIRATIPVLAETLNANTDVSNTENFENEPNR